MSLIHYRADARAVDLGGLSVYQGGGQNLAQKQLSSNEKACNYAPWPSLAPALIH